MKIKNATLDAKRRLVMPADCPPRSRVTIHSLDQGTWVVQQSSAKRKVKIIALPVVSRLPDDPEMDALADKAARANFKKLPPFDEL